MLIILTKQEMFKIIYNITPVIGVMIVLYQLHLELFSTTFLLLALAVNFLMLELKDSREIYSYMFNIVTVGLGLYVLIISRSMLGTDLMLALSVMWILLVFAIGVLLLQGKGRRMFTDSLVVVTVSSLGLLHVFSFVADTNIFESYFISIIQIALLAVFYRKYGEDIKSGISIILPLYFIVTGSNIIFSLGLSYHAYIIFAIATFVIAELFRNRSDIFHTCSFAIAHAFVLAIYLFTIRSTIDSVIYLSILMAIYAYSYKVQKQLAFKYVSYVISNFVLLAGMRVIFEGHTILLYIPLITTLGIMGLEYANKNLRDAGSESYLAVSKVITFIALYLTMSLVGAIISIVFAVIIMAENMKYRKEVWNTLPLVSIMPVLFANALSSNISLSIIMGFVLGTTAISLLRREVSLFTMFSGIYLLFAMPSINNMYSNLLLFMVWSSLHWFRIGPEKFKDIFKSLFYLSALFLYNVIIRDLGMNTIAAFELIRIYCCSNDYTKNHTKKIYA